jgi:enamine deaminase RidA (YjgF/YER057c/UK114 family)
MTIKRYPGRAAGRSKSVEHGGIIYTVAGGPDSSTGFKSQIEQALQQLDANLAEAGSDKTRLLSVTVYLTDISKKSILNEVWDAWIGPDHWPQRACIEVKLEGDTLVELVALAAKFAALSESAT